MGALAPLLLGDGRLPVGAYTYSAGLEPAVAAGLTRDRVPALLKARLHTTARTEAAAPSSPCGPRWATRSTTAPCSGRWRHGPRPRRSARPP